MARKPLRSFANRLTLAYVGVATALLFLIGFASTLFTFQLYARTTNEVVAAATHSVERRAAQFHALGIALPMAAPRIIADLERPRIRVAVYDQASRLLAGREEPLAGGGFVRAVASLMDLHRSKVAIPGGFIVVSADLGTLDRTLRAYWLLMVPVGLIAVSGAWWAGWLITRTAVLPLRQISAGMRRFANGDFRPEPLRSSRNDELGELAHAYNGALHQVRSAFAERDRSEAEIRQFIADAGHELRTPLTVIMGYLDVLEEGAANAPQTRERVFQNLRQESRRMRSLIEKLIRLARLERGESGHRTAVDISAIVSRVATSLAPVDPEDRIEASTVPNARVLADESEIAEAVRNVIENALKYASPSHVRVSTAVTDTEILLSVRDEGPGMSEEDRAHAFDRFYRGHNVGDVQGSGLGLAIVQRAVRRADGTIELESIAGKGTRFTIRFPRLED